MKNLLFKTRLRSAVLLAGSFACSPSAWSQLPATGTVLLAANDSLPDAPSALLRDWQPLAATSSSISPTTFDVQAEPAATPTARVPAKHLSMLIDPNQDAAPVTARMKFEMSIRKQATVGELGSAATAAAYGNWRNLRPHYGTDTQAFGQRFGAALIRQTSQSIFYVGLFSTVMKQDPRYYVMGPTHSFKRRFGYAASRVVVTRTDAGRNVPNVSLWSGVLGASLLTDAYYPDQDHDLVHAARSAAFSLMYRLATQQLKEFHRDIEHKLHLKRDS